MKARRWTLEGLACVLMLALTGAANGAIADELDRSPADVDLALWALVGRTPEEALLRLNSGRDAAVRSPASARAEAAEVIRGLRSLASDDDEILTEPLSSLRGFLAHAADVFDQVVEPSLAMREVLA